MNITQTFYDNMATQYDKLFLDWQATTREQAEILDKLFAENGFDHSAKILDCACGIGTQAIGLATLGYNVTASDISDGELAQAAERAGENYRLTQYIIDDEEKLQTGKFVCEYRATRREELTKMMLSHGCSEVVWKFTEETGFYQPIVVARK